MELISKEESRRRSLTGLVAILANPSLLQETMVSGEGSGQSSSGVGPQHHQRLSSTEWLTSTSLGVIPELSSTDLASPTSLEGGFSESDQMDVDIEIDQVRRLCDLANMTIM